MAILLIKNAQVLAPQDLGKKDILVIDKKIMRIGKIDEDGVKRLELPYELIDAEGSYVTPGFIDPHEHLIGGSGESGFCSRTPEITMPEIIGAGITTVVGCLGVDVVMRNMASLVGQARIFNDEGMTAYVWTGGYQVPSATLTGSVVQDMFYVTEVIGAGEIAVSDYRSSCPSERDLAKIVKEAHNGGLMTGKAGVTHFHLGDGKEGLDPIVNIIRDYDITPEMVYPTHVERNDRLLKQGAHLTHQGVTVDFDVEEQDLVDRMKQFHKHGGKLEFLTISSDAAKSSPGTLYEQIREVMKEFSWELGTVLPTFTSNTARILKLKHKGRIEVGCDADLVIMDQQEFKINTVIAKGKVFVRNGKFCYSLRALEKSNRTIELYGKKKTR